MAAKKRPKIVPKPRSATAYYVPARQAAKKPIAIHYPKPDEMAGKVKMEPPKIPQHVEPIDITPTRMMATEGKKKAIPYAVTAAGAAFLISAGLAAFMYYAINLDLLFSVILALTFFVGLSILFYEFLELAERTAK